MVGFIQNEILLKTLWALWEKVSGDIPDIEGITYTNIGRVRNGIFGSILGGNLRELAEGFPRVDWSDISGRIFGIDCGGILKASSRRSNRAISRETLQMIFWKKFPWNCYKKSIGGLLKSSKAKESFWTNGNPRRNFRTIICS